jgi:ParB-like chromosome segregation protein Spo0J
MNNNHIVPELRHLAVPISKLHLDAANARKHDARNTATTKASLVRFKFRLPIVVQKQGMIIRAGNNRTRIAKELGWKTVPAIVVDESDVEAVAYALVDNRSAELAVWEQEGLTDVLKYLRTQSTDLEALGFSTTEVAPLLEGWTAEPEELLPAPPRGAPGGQGGFTLTLTEDEVALLRRTAKAQGRRTTKHDLVQTIVALCHASAP